MSQQIDIDLGGGPEGALPPGFWEAYHQGDLFVHFLTNGTESGRAVIRFGFKGQGGKHFGLEITARNFVGIMAAVRGKLISTGEIPVTLNPAIALAADPMKRQVHLATEAPMQSWSFTVPEAKKFWRVLREIAEEASR